MAETPTLRRKLLGKDLEHLRIDAGLDQDAAAALIGKGQSGIAKIEGGFSTPSVGDLEKLLVNYGITEQAQPDAWNRCLEWRKGARQPRNYWSGHRAIFSESFRQFVELEQDCDLLYATATENLPDWVQSERYMRTLFTTRPSRQSVEESVAARLARQQVFLDAHSPELHIVMSESSLRRQFGPPEMMAAAIDHVIELSKLKNFKIQVIPFAYRPGRTQARIGYRFTRFRIPSQGLAGPLIYVCTFLGKQYQYTDDPQEVSLHGDEFAELSAIAPDYVNSRNLMIEIRDELSR